MHCYLEKKPHEQSRVENEYYSITYFDHITAFKALRAWLICTAYKPHILTLLHNTYEPAVQRYSTLNTVIPLKYTTE